MTPVEIFFSAIGMMAAIFGSSYAVVTIWTAVSESAERRRKDTRRVLDLLERIEANTAPSIKSTSADRV